MSAAAAVPDITEMSAVHRVFRNAFSAAPGLIGDTPDGDTARAAVVGSFVSNVIEFLDVHHSGEDELLYPPLLERSDQKDLIARVAGQHHDVDGAVAAVRSTVAAWTASGSTADGKALVAAIGELDTILLPHLDDEEREIMPIVEAHITVDEWAQMPGHAMGAFKGDNLWLILGLVREQMSQEQRDRMLEGMPPPAVDAWNSVGIAAYKQTVSDLVGPREGS